MLAGSASAACGVEGSCGVLRSKANFVNDIVWMPGDVPKIFDLFSSNNFKEFLCVCVLVDPGIGFGSIDICGLDFHCASKLFTMPGVHFV